MRQRERERVCVCVRGRECAILARGKNRRGSYFSVRDNTTATNKIVWISFCCHWKCRCRRQFVNYISLNWLVLLQYFLIGSLFKIKNLKKNPKLSYKLKKLERICVRYTFRLNLLINYKQKWKDFFSNQILWLRNKGLSIFR